MTIGANLVEFRPPRIAIGLAAIAIVAHFVTSLQLHPSLPLAALLLACTGFAVMIRAWWLFRIAGTAICPTEASSSLVTHDILSISRNPMYLGMTLMMLGLAVGLGSAISYIAALAYGVLMDRVFCPYEEQKALAEFGERYARYRDDVGRWI